ncbi:hypothetical protein [Periweissella fabalis]|uniref:Uncharacterized protein n=1 Tax=Periweissella fabalis TaxID=1070421 RepID=A0A7X6MZX5_9LACO|nr:hypothetical protein [Periweissella fabalis]MCM0598966.1 hypothetical protein [Periweissella fabalis]NKZ23246.1 hypothetical protein [Periweissella fabalis]
MFNNKLQVNGPKMSVGSIVDPSQFARVSAEKNFLYHNSVVKPAPRNGFFKFFSK